MTNVQFQSMNKLTQSDDYTITLARKHIGEKKIIISLLRIETWIHFIQGLFVTLFETDQSSVYFNVIYHYLPLEKGVTVWPWTKLNSLYLIGWNGPSGYRESVFKYPHCTFAISENLYCLLNWIERCPFLEHTWVRVIQGCCVSGLLEIGSVWSLQFVLLLTLRIEVLLWQLSLKSFCIYIKYEEKTSVGCFCSSGNSVPMQLPDERVQKVLLFCCCCLYKV